MTNISDLLSFTQQITTAAGELVQEYAKQPIAMHSKGFRDVVTDADFAAQKLITTAVQEKYPDHAFLTEEEDSSLPETGEWVWVIDPIDGTSNYSRQIPNYCVSVAVAKRVGNDLDIQVGVVYDPVQQQLYSAAKGEGGHL